MDEEELLYREMDEEDPYYMGDNRSRYYDYQEEENFEEDFEEDFDVENTNVVDSQTIDEHQVTSNKEHHTNQSPRDSINVTVFMVLFFTIPTILFLLLICIS